MTFFLLYMFCIMGTVVFCFPLAPNNWFLLLTISTISAGTLLYFLTSFIGPGIQQQERKVISRNNNPIRNSWNSINSMSHGKCVPSVSSTNPNVQDIVRYAEDAQSFTIIIVPGSIIAYSSYHYHIQGWSTKSCIIHAIHRLPLAQHHTTRVHEWILYDNYLLAH